MSEEVIINKILLMGKVGSGKTSIKSMIFCNSVPQDSCDLPGTVNIEYSHIRFLGNFIISLWDCGGKDIFLKNYLYLDCEKIFSHVKALIYIFDVKSIEYENEIVFFEKCIENLNKFSNNIPVYCFLHKMDLIEEEFRETIFNKKVNDFIKAAPNNNIKCFQSSIYNESIYFAWSHIMRSILPNARLFQKRLAQLCSVIDSSEAIIFDKETLIIVSYYFHNDSFDTSNFERLSYIMKKFKMSCSKIGIQFKNVILSTDEKKIYLCCLTNFSYLLISLDEKNLKKNFSQCKKHIKEAAIYFKTLERENGPICSLDRDAIIYDSSY